MIGLAWDRVDSGGSSDHGCGAGGASGQGEGESMLGTMVLDGVWVVVLGAVHDMYMLVRAEAVRGYKSVICVRMHLFQVWGICGSTPLFD